MKIKKVYCFFEQSGTFKNAFRKLGIEAEDYDILNDFNQTDHVIDLFSEIDKCCDGRTSIFDQITGEDLIFAFFPCTRFESQATLSFRGKANGQKKWSITQKLEYDMKLMNELHTLYDYVSKLVILAATLNLKLIIENPYHCDHFLKNYWALEPSIIDLDRRLLGDYYEKPTQYFFINCEPEHNFVFEAIPHNTLGHKIEKLRKEHFEHTGAKKQATSKVNDSP